MELIGQHSPQSEHSLLIAAIARLAESGPFTPVQEALLQELVALVAETPTTPPVTARTQVAASTPTLVDAEARFRGFIESAPDGVVIINELGQIVLINRQTEILFGYQRDELLGQPLEILIPERFHHHHEQDRTNYIRAPHTRPMGVGLSLYGRHRDGHEFPVEISLSSSNSPDGLTITAVVRDVTEQRRAAHKLQQTAALLARQTAELARSNQELEQFAYIASHDLQEPLRMVASYTQLLARRYRGQLDADADEFIGYAVDGANRMHQLIQDLLAYSRVGTRGHPFIVVDCNELIDTVTSDLAPFLEETRATVRHAPLPTVLGDPTQVRQLFQNLIGNALKYRQPTVPPLIQITAEPDSSWWHFTIRDNGIGIAPEYFERIFVIFQRLHTQDEYSGTGIGLAICKKIVDRHGGQIWVESTLDAGTAFHFTLPREDPGQEGRDGND